MRKPKHRELHDLRQSVKFQRNFFGIRTPDTGRYLDIDGPNSLLSVPGNVKNTYHTRMLIYGSKCPSILVPFGGSSAKSTHYLKGILVDASAAA